MSISVATIFRHCPKQQTHKTAQAYSSMAIYSSRVTKNTVGLTDGILCPILKISGLSYTLLYYGPLFSLALPSPCVYNSIDSCTAPSLIPRYHFQSPG